MAIKLKSTAKSAAMTWKKIAVHGPSGIGKTLLAATCAPFKPLVIVTEKTGEESLQPASIIKAFGAERSDILYDIDYLEAYTPEDFEQALKFAEKSDHDLVIFDSLSKASRLILKAAKAENTHGLKAYGQHNEVLLKLLEGLMDAPKHIICNCHTTRIQDEGTGDVVYVPGFEGKSAVEKFVYELAHILHLEMATDDDGNSYRALRAHQNESDRFAKNRGGQLDELEEPHIGRLIQKLSGVTPTAVKKKRPQA